MSDSPAEQVLKDLLPHFERIDSQNGALIQILKDKGIVSDEEFAKYLDQAEVGSNVKWRAVLARLEYLFSPVEKDRGKDKESTDAKEGKK